MNEIPHTRVILVSVVCLLVIATLIYDNTSNGKLVNIQKMSKLSPLYQTDVNKSDKKRKCEDRCCNAKRHFVFIKTHKTASSTIKHMLDRYIARNNITTAKPWPEPFVGGYPGHINFKLVKKSDNEPHKHIEAINDHLRFDAQVLRQNMPSDTVYFTILREPWAQFQSSFHYYNKWAGERLKPNCLNLPNTLVKNGSVMTSTQFLHRCVKVLDRRVPWYFRAKNYQAHDLGVDPWLTDQQLIKERIQQLESSLDLVMITEYFDVSVILLKDLLCLSWNNVVYKIKKHFTYKTEELSNKNRNIFEQWNALDHALYQHFNKTLWRKVREYGEERMEKDRQKLNYLLNKTVQKTAKQHPKQHQHIISNTSIINIKEIAKTMFRYSIPETTAVKIASYMGANSGGCMSTT
uniref:Galactose-3-O-sulfotransferase 3 n=1 Tax=Ciona intestinalis TaxID=7719 RepID=F6XS58_CIOIN|nr:galactose-3-O-sulfotransferase 3 [Ciona intestinalis]|eukprot:XP_002119399.1 galactose-3-O-sulfotransferase 3 [Ciona intestinalis]